MEIRGFFPFNSCLKHKTSLLPSIHRTPPLFCQTSSQRRPRKMPGSKTNADQSKGVERNHCTGAARSNLRASLLGPNTQRCQSRTRAHPLLLAHRASRSHHNRAPRLGASSCSPRAGTPDRHICTERQLASECSVICASHGTGSLPKQQSAFMEERVP